MDDTGGAVLGDLLVFSDVTPCQYKSGLHDP